MRILFKEQLDQLYQAPQQRQPDNPDPEAPRRCGETHSASGHQDRLGHGKVTTMEMWTWIKQNDGSYLMKMNDWLPDIEIKQDKKAGKWIAGCVGAKEPIATDKTLLGAIRHTEWRLLGLARTMSFNLIISTRSNLEEPRLSIIDDSEAPEEETVVDRVEL